MTAALITAVRENCPKNWLTVSEAAAKVGRSIDTLTKWRQRGLFEPSEHIWFGDLKVYLYTPADIKALKEFAKTMRPGPKPGSKHKRAPAAVKAQRQKAVRTHQNKTAAAKKSVQARKRKTTTDAAKIKTKLKELATAPSKGPKVNGAKKAPARKKATKS